MAETYESQDAFIQELKEDYQNGEYRDAVELMQEHDFEVSDDLKQAVLKRYQAAKKLGKVFGQMPKDNGEAARFAAYAASKGRDDLAEDLTTVYHIDKDDIRDAAETDEDDDRLYDLDQEAVYWPDSDQHDQENETFYHATTVEGAKGIIEDRKITGRSGGTDHAFDDLKTIDPAAYIDEHREEIQENGPESVREYIDEHGFETLKEHLQAYEGKMNVNSQREGARRDLGPGVARTKDDARGGARYDPEAIIELTLPE
ncbi:MAG: hypothetical protein SVU32_08400, partial [Candidatus Nanohaloarchaea archaeon]|nr:hypothetical protein [Candidatus Nanohaloarchaea archaeon]